MYAVLPIGGYVFLAVLLFFLIYNSLGRASVSGNIPGGLRLVFCPLYLITAVLPVIGAFLPDGSVKFGLQAAGNIWLGFFIYYVGILLLFFTGKSLAVRIRSTVSHKEIPDRQHSGNLKDHKQSGIRTLFLLFLLAAALVGYGMIHAQHTKVTRMDIRIGEENPGGRELKLILIADLHLSVNSNLAMIEQMVETINAEEADAVLIAGDFFTSSYKALKNPARYADVLRSIKAREGVYAVYGNHDVEETLFGGFPISPISHAFRPKEMDAFLEACGFTVLKDSFVTLDNGQLQLAGRIDGEKAGDGTANRMDAASLLSRLDSSKPVLVLEHEPKDFRELKNSGADLVLCGHTHNGQIFPGNLIVPFFNENAYGLKEVDGMTTVVTSGIGYYGPPMRIGTNSEVMVLTLHY